MRSSTSRGGAILSTMMSGALVAAIRRITARHAAIPYRRSLPVEQCATRPATLGTSTTAIQATSESARTARSARSVRAMRAAGVKGECALPRRCRDRADRARFAIAIGMPVYDPTVYPNAAAIGGIARRVAPISSPPRGSIQALRRCAPARRAASATNRRQATRSVFVAGKAR